MSQTVPLSIVDTIMDNQARRCRAYLDLYRGKEKQGKKSCISSTVQVMDQIEKQSDTEQNQTVEMTPELASTLVEVLGQQINVLGILQEEEDTLEQFKMHVEERGELAAKYQHSIQESVKAANWWKAEAKEDKSQSKSSLQSFKRTTSSSDNEGKFFESESEASMKMRKEVKEVSYIEISDETIPEDSEEEQKVSYRM